MSLFWGIELEPGKEFVSALAFDLHLSLATLGPNAKKGRHVIQCKIDGRVFTLGSLRTETCENLALDLIFDEGKELTFSVEGPSPINLMGYYIAHAGDSDAEDEGDVLKALKSYGLDEESDEEEIDEEEEKEAELQRKIVLRTLKGEDFDEDEEDDNEDYDFDEEGDDEGIDEEEEKKVEKKEEKKEKEKEKEKEKGTPKVGEKRIQPEIPNETPSKKNKNTPQKKEESQPKKDTPKDNSAKNGKQGGKSGLKRQDTPIKINHKEEKPHKKNLAFNTGQE